MKEPLKNVAGDARDTVSALPEHHMTSAVVLQRFV